MCVCTRHFFLSRSMKQDQRSSCTSRICCALLERSTCEILCYPRANHLFRKRPNPSAHTDGMATDRIPLLLAPGGTTPPRLFFFFCSHSLLVKTVIAVKVSPPPSISMKGKKLIELWFSQKEGFESHKPTPRLPAKEQVSSTVMYNNNNTGCSLLKRIWHTQPENVYGRNPHGRGVVQTAPRRSNKPNIRRHYGIYYSCELTTRPILMRLLSAEL